MAAKQEIVELKKQITVHTHEITDFMAANPKQAAFIISILAGTLTSKSAPIPAELWARRCAETLSEMKKNQQACEFLKSLASEIEGFHDADLLGVA